RRPSERMPLRAALQPRHREVPARQAAARRARARAPVRVLASVPSRLRGRARPRRRGDRVVTTIETTRPQPVSAVPEPILSVQNLVQEFVTRGPGGVKAGVVHAVSDVSFDLFPGETLGIVGETGSGKSTLARAIIGVDRPKSGVVRYLGRDLMGLSKRDLKR